MLKKPEVHAERILKVADAILNSNSFNMANWCNCIHGHTCEVAGISTFVSEGSHMELNMSGSIEYLGLTTENGNKLFQNWHQTKEQAAKMLRHLAVTGEVQHNFAPVV